MLPLFLALQAPPLLGVRNLPDDVMAISLGNDSSNLMLFGMVGMGGGSRTKEERLLFSLVGSVLLRSGEFEAAKEAGKGWLKGYTLDLAKMNQTGGGTPSPVFAETFVAVERIVSYTVRAEVTKPALLAAFPGAPGKTTPNESSQKIESLSNLKQIALGAIIWSGDYDDRLPKADSAAAFQKQVLPYTKNPALFKPPHGGRYLYNTALSNVVSSSLENPARTILVWEEKPFSDGTRAVAFADGHVKRLTPAEWDAEWKRETERRKRAKRG